MGLFDIFRKRTDGPQAAAPAPSPSPLSSTCYEIAYFILPHYAFKDCDKLIKMFTEVPSTAGPFFYVMGCQMQKIEPVREDATRFRTHLGELGGAHEYFVMEYPTPPSFDLGGTDPTQLLSKRLPVLAPYFSAIIRQRDTKAVEYYALGQAPFGGGTTLRSVTPEGANCNLGPGPEPQLDAFLARLRRTGD